MQWFLVGIFAVVIAVCVGAILFMVQFDYEIAWLMYALSATCLISTFLLVYYYWLCKEDTIKSIVVPRLTEMNREKQAANARVARLQDQVSAMKASGSTRLSADAIGHIGVAKDALADILQSGEKQSGEKQSDEKQDKRNIGELVRTHSLPPDKLSRFNSTPELSVKPQRLSLPGVSTDASTQTSSTQANIDTEATRLAIEEIKRKVSGAIGEVPVDTVSKEDFENVD